MIGVVNNEKYSEDTLDFPQGSKLFLFTDGLFEEFNKSREEFGEERLVSILQNTKNYKINEIIQNIQNNLETFLGDDSFQDDITIIGIES